jgi:hypothetical protein
MSLPQRRRAARWRGPAVHKQLNYRAARAFTGGPYNGVVYLRTSSAAKVGAGLLTKSIGFRSGGAQHRTLPRSVRLGFSGRGPGVSDLTVEIDR